MELVQFPQEVAAFLRFLLTVPCISRELSILADGKLNTSCPYLLAESSMSIVLSWKMFFPRPYEALLYVPTEGFQPKTEGDSFIIIWYSFSV